MKKGLCCVLALMLLLGSISLADSKETTITGYAFDLRFHLNPEAFPASARKHMRGYADLLEVLTFRGSCFYDPSQEALSLCLDLIPDSQDADPVHLNFYGYEGWIMLASNLLGDGNDLLLSIDSLLEFAVKTYAHLGVQLQHIALCWPYVYRSSLATPLSAWKKYIAPSHKSRTISAKSIGNFLESYEWALEDDRNMAALINALGIGNGQDETVRGEFDHFSSYIRDVVTKGKKVTVQVAKTQETWTNAQGQMLYSQEKTDHEEAIHTYLPETSTGYLPTFDFVRTENDQRMDLSLEAGWVRTEGENLFDVFFDAASLPTTWPMDNMASFALSIDGALFPNMSLTGRLVTEAGGYSRLEVSSAATPDAILLSGEGTILPGEYTVPYYTWDKIYARMDILRSNDATLAEYTSRVASFAARGLLSFLTGVPASACQSVMNDMEDAGVLNLLLDGI